MSNKKQETRTEQGDEFRKDKSTERGNTEVESDTGKRPSKDTNPLPPNPNKVDNHEDEE